MKTLDEFQKEVGEWGDTTFPKSTLNSVVAHFSDESSEFIESFDNWYTGKNDILQCDVEAADCALLLLHYCFKRKISLMGLMQWKMEQNKKRTWSNPDWRGVVRHEEEK